MIYNLSVKAFGTNKIVNVAKFETEGEICDICCVNGLGVVFSIGKYLGLIDESGNIVFPWKGTDSKRIDGTNPSFGNLTGLGYHEKSSTLFVCEDGGINIRAIDIRSDYTKSLISKNNEKFLKGLLKNFSNENVAYISPISKNRFYLVIDGISKCLLFKDNRFLHIAGDGKFRYSVGTSAQHSSIGYPKWLANKGGKLYMSDYATNIVRKIDKESISICCGSLKKDRLKNPSKLSLSDNVLYVMCNENIRSYMINTNYCGDRPIYESDKIVNITSNADGGLYILEKSNA